MITTPVAAALAKAASPSPLCQRISLGWAAAASITLDEAVDLARTGGWPAACRPSGARAADLETAYCAQVLAVTTRPWAAARWPPSGRV
jgi:hypothetical protein